jgi:hypothetical protein
VIPVVVAAVAVGAAGVAVAGSHTSASNRRAAHNDARHLLSLLVLPPGAVSSPTDPSVDRLLGSPGLGTGSVGAVDRHRFWRVPGDPTAVLASVEGHPPAGSRLMARGSSSGPSGDTRSDDFSFAAVHGVLLSRSLVVTVAAARGGGTAVRADAEIVWVQPRARSERVPASAHVVSITDRRLDVQTGKSTTSAPLLVTDPAKVRRIAALVNGLPRSQLGVVPCPADSGPNVDLKFSAVQGGRVLAEANADGSGCGEVSFSRNGKAKPALSGGPGLIHRLGKLLGVKF